MAKSKNRNYLMDGIRYDLGGGRPVRIVPIGDIHIGDRMANMRLVADMVERIRSDPDCFVVLCGDLMNTAIVGSKSDIYAEEMTPDAQIDKAVELLSPISDRILAIVPGNHEERISKTAGTDTTKRLAAELGCKDLYRPEAALLYIRTGRNRNGGTKSKNVYSVYINHGHGGGGRRAGSKVNSLQDLGYVIDADIIIAGHTHMPATFRTSHIKCHPETGTADLHEQVFVNTASALTYGGYGQRGGYQPPSNTYPVIELGGDGYKTVKVTI